MGAVVLALVALVAVFLVVRLVVGPIGHTRQALFRPKDDER